MLQFLENRLQIFIAKEFRYAVDWHKGIRYWLPILGARVQILLRPMVRVVDFHLLQYK